MWGYLFGLKFQGLHQLVHVGLVEFGFLAPIPALSSRATFTIQGLGCVGQMFCGMIPIHQLVTVLKMFIRSESLVDRGQITTQLTFVHRYWGPAMKMEIVPIDSTQTLILIPPPPDPGNEDVSNYEDRILEQLPCSSASIRLARVDGHDARVLALIRTALREQRHHCWMQIQSGLIRSLGLEICEGDLDVINQDIRDENGDGDSVEYSPSRDDNLVLDLWGKGYTAKRIALRIGRTEKTILNKLTLMRKAYGEQLVSRRRLA